MNRKRALRMIQTINTQKEQIKLLEQALQYQALNSNGVLDMTLLDHIKARKEVRQ